MGLRAVCLQLRFLFSAKRVSPGPVLGRTAVDLSSVPQPGLSVGFISARDDHSGSGSIPVSLFYW